ncbi:hypothetical protein AB0G02_11410 [Actinosynnema sp. NPDC023658]|uniref:hypothetical protein n=1 Tax=Actinosynnema sp. NPDC023658 TaxID=3155465 RepID=UPI0033F3BEB3
MARWVWPAAAGVVTSATGVAINLATDGRANPWAWAAVVLLTALGVVIALRVQPEAPTAPPATGAPPAAEDPPKPQEPTTTVHNSVSGTVNGSLVQGGTFGAVTINSPTTVNQTAIARDGSTIHQAGRDVRRD